MSASKRQTWIARLLRFKQGFFTLGVRSTDERLADLLPDAWANLRQAAMATTVVA